MTELYLQILEYYSDDLLVSKVSKNSAPVYSGCLETELISLS